MLAVVAAVAAAPSSSSFHPFKKKKKKKGDTCVIFCAFIFARPRRLSAAFVGMGLDAITNDRRPFLPNITSNFFVH